MIVWLALLALVLTGLAVYFDRWWLYALSCGVAVLVAVSYGPWWEVRS